MMALFYGGLTDAIELLRITDSKEESLNLIAKHNSDILKLTTSCVKGPKGLSAYTISHSIKLEKVLLFSHNDCGNPGCSECSPLREYFIENKYKLTDNRYFLEEYKEKLKNHPGNDKPSSSGIWNRQWAHLKEEAKKDFSASDKKALIHTSKNEGA